MVEWFKLADLSHFFDEEGDHAGEMETSIMMYYFPELVLPLAEAGNGFARKFKLPGLQNKTAWAPRHWTKVTDDTGVGNPKKASEQKGWVYLQEITGRISDYLVELNNCDLNDLYG